MTNLLPTKKKRTTNKNPPTQEQLEKDARTEIAKLNGLMYNRTPHLSTSQIPSYAEKSAWLTEEIKLRTTTVGTTVFRTELEQVRDIGEPVEAIPTIP
jgi:hypothetical protein